MADLGRRSIMTLRQDPGRRSIMTLREVECFEQVVKKSRFIAVAAPVTSAKAALDFVRERSVPKATHNVYAWRLANGDTSSNNDGEPAGTAGPPVLAAICSAGLHDVSVLVIRHYGGVQLGTGGLARAYGSTAAACLASATPMRVAPRELVRVRFGPSDTAAVFAIAGTCSPHVVDTGHGTLEATFEWESTELEWLNASLKSATAGRVESVVVPAAEDGPAYRVRPRDDRPDRRHAG